MDSSAINLSWAFSAGLQLKEALEGVSDILSNAALAYEESENAIAGSFRG